MAQEVMAPAPPPPESAATERPLRELLVELWENTEKLMRQEVQLASTELDGKISKIKTDVSAAAIGGAVMYAGLLAIVAAVILLLSQIMVAWLAALIVGAVVAGAGYAMTRKAKGLDRDAFVPQRAINSIKEDVSTFKEAMR